MDIVYEKRTDKSLNEAIHSLEENLKENNFGILWQLNFKNKLAEKGLDLKDDFVVLEVCNPKQAKEVLEKNIHVGYVLPCKMVVRTEGDKTYIGMTSPEKLIGLFDELELSVIAKSVEMIMKKAIIASI
ncbi:Uncharacterized conserved protein, DUF302 family [Carnobacterium iners]|uniref:Uncharacterized conserved protein, DUF302 family n=1 Tax=Carnobacterium iners TaxID=1073423 RepID=A0A1X7MTU4_9LACT|nr:DUF302 domain-containing protein [Carnobacterium iners]SEK56624.1 Uncharacterized conserved protein, DUF302 family [Carnobacterium iners]SMH28155.1 Uncharacterized conserved protein, DUF302 family [Carnobacterium iners]